MILIYGLRMGWLQWNGERVRQELNLPGKDWNKEITKSPEDGEEYKPGSYRRR